MKPVVTRSIVLTRTDYGEADRILTLLTPDYGKLRLMARGVRKMKSKLAGGIELFSVSEITFMRGKGEIGTLISTRLVKYYDHIVQDIDRVQLGYELIKMLNRATEDEPEAAYFELLQQAFMALDDAKINQDLIRLWFSAQLLRIAGHTPNLLTDTAGQKLDVAGTYSFDFDDMTFTPHPEGPFDAPQIKFLRLIFAGHQPKALQNIQNTGTLLPTISPLVQTMLTFHIRV